MCDDRVLRSRGPMKRRTFLTASASAVALLSLPSTRASAQGAAPMPKSPPKPILPPLPPLLAPFAGPHGGVPPFDKIAVADFKPAILAGMDLQRAEIARLVAEPAAPTFTNTLEPFEDSGRPLGRAIGIMGTYTGTMNTPAMQAVETELAPVLSAYGDEVIQNAALFARLKTVYEGRAKAGLAPDQLRLLEHVYKNFARRGAALAPKAKARLTEINQKLASAFTTFSQNQLFDEEQGAVVLDKEADLAGLPAELVAAARAEAEGRGKPGAWLISNTRSSAEPFLTYASRRDLREKVWQMWVSRGEHAGAHDNRPLITQILALRAERAKLLGFTTHAHWILDDSMAKAPDRAMALMKQVWTAATARVREEVAAMQAIADQANDGKGAGHKIAPWDYRYYAEKVRKATYDLDQNEVKPYLQVDKLREALFFMSKQLYGLTFTPVKGVPVYHPDVKVWAVTRGKARVGLWYFDPYAREGKRSGAWMSEYRTQEAFRGALTPIVSNNSNFVQGARPKKGAKAPPVLISWDDATTMFHEFGHALHGLLSNVRYPTLAGTNTLRDFVEFPSQLAEYWLSTHEVLAKFAVHHKTGKPMPKALSAKIEKAKDFNQGFKTVEYLMSAIYDLEIHTAPGGKPIDPIAFEKALFGKLGAPTEIVMRHRPPAFGHIFADDGYSAGYYSYIWADTLTADAAEAFEEARSFYDKKTAKKLHDAIMSVGNSVPPDEAFRNFRGRDVDTNALMRSRGFPVVAKG